MTRTWTTRRSAKTGRPEWHNGRMTTTLLVPPRPTPAATAPTPAPSGTPPKPKGGGGSLDQRTLTAAGTFGVLLRNGQTWQTVKLLEMDAWNLLLETEHGCMLLPKHAVDAYLLDPS